jgi:integrase
VTVPSFRRPAQRIDWTLLARTLRKDTEKYLSWCRGSDAFAVDARSRALAPRTVQLRQSQIHAAVTALVESGVATKSISSLATLVSPQNFKRILRRRHEMVEGDENIFNHDLAFALIDIAGRWVKVDVEVLTELKRLAAKVPTPIQGLSARNKHNLRQFDDPAVLLRLYSLPTRLWAEVKREAKPNFRTLVKAQAALAIGILSYMPVRPQNLAALTFDLHLFMHQGPGAKSTLELPAAEVKNRTEVAFDIPPHLAKMLIEYRNRIAPKVIGKRPDRLFVKADSTPKNQWSVGWMIRKYLRKRAGIVLSPHQFRHLSAKVILDREPGNFETPRQLLGHKSVGTTATIYAGISTRRAARHHQRLVEEPLAAANPVRRSKKLAS